jgi:general stress protein YciG
MANEPTQEVGPKKRRGFAAMSAEKQREIASRGGKAAHAKGTAHVFDSEEAREAGRKGGVAAQKARASKPT